jgi:hypothetical protein
MSALAYIGIAFLLLSGCGIAVFFYEIAHAIPEEELYKTKEQHGTEEETYERTTGAKNIKSGSAS